MIMSNLPLLSILIWTPILGGLILLFIKEDKNDLIKYISYTFTSLVFIISLIVLSSFNPESHHLQLEEKVTWISNLNINYHIAVDGFSIVFILLTTVTTLIINLYSFSESREQNNKYLSLFLILEGIILGVFCAFDSILFYIFFEAMLIPLFLIIGIWGGSNRVYATIKFFIYTLVGSVLMLISLIYLSMQTSSFFIYDFYGLDLPLSVQIYLFIAFLIAFGIKIPMWPVHTWLPDAHVQAPSSGSVILAAVLLKVGGYGMIRFLLPITPDAGVFLNDVIVTLSLIAIIYISFVALAQKDMKKLIAYSSIAHMGFVTLGIFLTFNALDKEIIFNREMILIGLQGAVMQMISHGLISAGLFICIGVIYTRTKSREINEQSGIGQVMPVFSALMMFFLLSNSGLPGTSGFVGEFMVLISSLEINTIYGLLASTTLVLAASYSLWLGKRVLFGEVSNETIKKMPNLKTTEFWPLFILTLMIIVIGVQPNIVLDLSHSASNNLINSLVGRP